MVKIRGNLHYLSGMYRCNSVNRLTSSIQVSRLRRPPHTHTNNPDRSPYPTHTMGLGSASRAASAPFCPAHLLVRTSAQAGLGRAGTTQQIADRLTGGLVSCHGKRNGVQRVDPNATTYQSGIPYRLAGGARAAGPRISTREISPRSPSLMRRETSPARPGRWVLRNEDDVQFSVPSTSTLESSRVF